MFISKEEYLNLKKYKDLNIELEKEIKRLEMVINTHVKNCKVGIWCEECEHWTTDQSSAHIIGDDSFSSLDMYCGLTMSTMIGGKVGYCRKHIHDLCPEFTKVANTRRECLCLTM